MRGKTAAASGRRRKVRENIPRGKREREGGKAKGKRENISRKTTPKPRREEENRQQFCPIWPVGRGKKDICLRPPAAARLVDGTN